jgi:hypothetical protein
MFAYSATMAASMMHLNAMWRYSGMRISPTVLGDENVANSKHGSLEADLSAWQQQLTTDVEATLTATTVTTYETDDEGSDEEDEEAEDVMDLEDLGAAMVKGKVGGLDGGPVMAEGLAYWSLVSI